MNASTFITVAVFSILISTLHSQDLTPGTPVWLIQRASLTTNDGVIGFSPGTKVTIVKDNGTNLVVSDGTHSFEIQRTQVTTDLSVGQSAAAADYKAQIALAKSQEKEVAEMNERAAKEAKANAAMEAETLAAAKSKRIIGRVLYQADGGLVVDAGTYPPPRPVTGSLGRVGGGGDVYSPLIGAGRAPAESEVSGTIWLIGYPKQATTADGDEIDARGYETGIHQLPDGSRVRRYKVVSNR